MAKRKSRKQPGERPVQPKPRAPRRPRTPKAQPPPPTLEQELKLLARDGAQLLRQWLIAVLIIGAIAGVAFAVWSIRPTPAYSSEELATGSPFDVTFKMENESSWFPLSNLRIHCIVAHIRASGLPPTIVEARNERFPSPSAASLEPGASASFTCPFRSLIGHPINEDPDIVRRSEIYFRAEYEVPYLPSIRITDNSPHFFFDTHVLPPRWVPTP
jgi:hypothetical protein